MHSVKNRFLMRHQECERRPVSPLLAAHDAARSDGDRRPHEAGRPHGAISPSTVALNGTAKLLAAPDEMGLTEYSAPEVQAGEPPSPQSDIFSMGALLYHLATGRTPPANAAEAAANSCGHPALDRIILKCLAPDPGLRYQSAQKLALELRLLGVSGRGSRSEGPTRWERAVEHLRTETASCLREQENHNEELKRTISEIIVTLRQELAAAEQRSLHTEDGLRQSGERLDQTARQVAEVSERFGQVNSIIDTLARQHADAQEAAAASHLALEAGMAKQTAKIESALTGIKQTDDLVAWVVEILETLQNTMMER
jgi:serine/threonine protein kinase